MIKVRPLFSQTFEVPENKVHLFFFIFGLLAEILTFCAFYQFTYSAKIACQKNSCSLKLALSFLK